SSRPPSRAGNARATGAPQAGRFTPASLVDAIRADPVGHVPARGIDQLFEQLFAALGVVRQRAMGEPEAISAVGADGVDDSSAVQRPQPEMPDQNRHHHSGFHRWTAWKKFDPSELEMFPRLERGPRAREIGGAVTDRRNFLVDAEAGRVFT